MHIQECEHPKRIYNKYIKEFVYVPCGKCPSCQRLKSRQWIERLNVERKCWRYALFFTLTYSNDCVPRLEKKGNFLVDLNHEHTAKGKPSPCICIDDYLKGTNVDVQRNFNLIQSNNVRYLSVYDVQCFVKRYRKNLKNAIIKNYKDAKENDYQVRYYIIGEYGPTTLRPHYHGLLFFSSEKQAACCQSVLSKSWQLGITDTSFVAESNATYLAKYLNCYTGLPTILTDKTIRPFAVFSKCPPIGTLYFKTEKVLEIFNNASPTMLVDYTRSLQLRNVPLWRTYIGRFFPKLSGFSNLSHSDRVTLYRAFANFQQYSYTECGASTFADFLIKKYEDYQQNRLVSIFSPLYLHCYHDYISYLTSHGDDLHNTLVLWYRLSARVCQQAAAFDISVEQYVSKIENFYNNCEYEKLKIQMKFEESYSENYGCESLVGIDKFWLESLLDVELHDMSAEEIITLQSFGIDVEKFTSNDLSIRLPYQEELLPSNQRDYLNVVIDNGIWLKKHTKNKVKNDYLDLHPELKLLTL